MRRRYQLSSRRPAHRPSVPDRYANLDKRVTKLVERVRPFPDRITRDDRLRATSSIVGLGIAAYWCRHRGHLPLGAVGAEALRLGLHRQFTFIRQKSGFTVEPSIGRRSFSITPIKHSD